MSSTRGRVKRVAQRTREWVRQTAPTLDSDSDVPSLVSSDEEGNYLNNNLQHGNRNMEGYPIFPKLFPRFSHFPDFVGKIG